MKSNPFAHETPVHIRREFEQSVEGEPMHNHIHWSILEPTSEGDDKEEMVQGVYHVAVEEVDEEEVSEKDIKEAPPQLKDRGQVTIDDLNELYLGTSKDGQTQGTYIIGGSAFRLNFITFVGEVPVYYGITEESFRANGSKETVL